MPLTDPALRELSGLYQISTEFWDWKGNYTEVDDASVVAVLRAFDVDASTPEKARGAVEAYRTRQWQRALPPCLVVEQGQTVTFPVHVRAGAGAHVFVRLEDGGAVEAMQTDNFEPDREIDGQWFGEASFVTPGDLPLGYHRLVLRSDDREVESSLVVTPTWLGFPRQMGDKRIWGFATQLYSVASRDSWGVGDLTDLADLAVWSATRHFASYVLINPLHAAQPVPPMEPSPYLPSSRRYVSPLYIRPEAIPEYASLSVEDRAAVDDTRRELVAEVAHSSRVERDDSWDAKREALELVFRAGRKAARQMAFE
ncbi:MAG TPA: 4-alpha-glucanotransferase, partial [Propionibacteriaceae bacterium]|nr:4-alpha-glucanotransferase [Propionibacteriaceae bacterium]